MKSEDVIKQLIAKLPNLTDQFTSQFNITGITVSGSTATVTTAAAHGLATNNLVSIVGARTDLPITSITRVKTAATIITSADHDVTNDQAQINFQGSPITVVLEGSNEAEFNGTFDVVSVPNRRTIVVEVPDSGATTATGPSVLIDGTAFGFNGVFTITVTGATTFEYTLPASDIPSPASGAIVGKTGYRISGAATFERAQAAYTKQGSNELWLFVVLDDVVASKDRHTQSDATSVKGRTNDVRQELIYPLNIFVFKNTTDESAGRKARDDMEVLFPLLCQSLIGVKFDSQLAAGKQHSLVFNQHGIADYTTATYQHVFAFETVADITFDDSIGYDVNVAFRDIDLSFTPDFDLVDDDSLAVLSTGINLDDEPLP